MDYPKKILPNPNYKLIDCDLSAHFVIRYTNTNDIDEIWDSTLNRVKEESICQQRDHIHDLSMSLLGVFTPDNIFIDFTEEGSPKYMAYCNPDAAVETPIYGADFITNPNRHYWWVSISKLHNVKFAYTRSDEPYEATCYVRHTPMLWNFWHFSLRWDTDLGSLENLDVKTKSKVAKRIGQAARVLIAHYASIQPPAFQLLDQNCYTKN